MSMYSICVLIAEVDCWTTIWAISPSLRKWSRCTERRPSHPKPVSQTYPITWWPSTAHQIALPSRKSPTAPRRSWTGSKVRWTLTCAVWEEPVPWPCPLPSDGTRRRPMQVSAHRNHPHHGSISPRGRSMLPLHPPVQELHPASRKCLPTSKPTV